MKGAARDLTIVCAAVLALSLPFLGKAYHMDEPVYIESARYVLGDPARALAFGPGPSPDVGAGTLTTPLRANPPLMLYVLALILKLTGGLEWATRLAFLPVGLAAAVGLYLLASRFLSRPLLPVLILLSCPAYLISMNLVMADNLAAALGFWGLYALVRGIEDREPRWYWASSGLLAAALLSKYSALMFLPPAAAYGLKRRVPMARVAAQLGLSAAGLAGYVGYCALFAAPALEAVRGEIARSASAWWSAWSQNFRACLAFAGGGGVVAAFWPFFVVRKSRLWAAALCLCAVVVLFSPLYDQLKPVTPIDRLTGLLMAWGALLGLVWLLGPQARSLKSWALSAPWILSVLALELLIYRSVSARLMLFLIAPLVLTLAEALEKAWQAKPLTRLYAASLPATLLLGLALALVDYRYAAAQKAFAAPVMERYRAQGKKVWLTGHWGLRYYVEKAGGAVLGEPPEGWELVRPGDVVIVPMVNDKLDPPSRPLSGVARLAEVPSAIPLRLMSGSAREGRESSQAGFYSSAWGFLPYAVSAEPVDEFAVIEVGKDWKGGVP